MKVGISTYAFFWQLNEKNYSPITVDEMLEVTKELGGEVFQICDYPLIEKMQEGELFSIAKKASELNIELELGTRGVKSDHLLNYLRIANLLGVKLIRTMFNTVGDTPTTKQAYERLLEVLPKYEKAEVKLAIETYEQVKTKDIISVVERIDSPYVGICLDPGNTIAALELPKDVVELSAPYVTNLHVKDFVFTRKSGWVGFSLVGCPLGEGLLDLDTMLKALKRENRDVNAIIELWLPFTNSMEETIRLEKEWMRKSFDYLRGNLNE